MIWSVILISIIFYGKYYSLYFVEMINIYYVYDVSEVFKKIVFCDYEKSINFNVIKIILLFVIISNGNIVIGIVIVFFISVN